MNKLYINTIFYFHLFCFSYTGCCAALFMFNVCLLFVYIVYNIHIWKNTWCCIILVSETKDWRLFELFLFKFLLTVCVATRDTRVSSWVLFLLRLVCFVFFLLSVLYITHYLHKVLLIRIYKCVCECLWVSEMMRLWVFVCFDLTKKLNK